MSQNLKQRGVIDLYGLGTEMDISLTDQWVTINTSEEAGINKQQQNAVN